MFFERAGERFSGGSVAFEYVSEESFSAFSDDLIAAFPQLNTEEAVMSVRSVSTRDPDSDPMGGMAGMTKITAMLRPEKSNR